MKYEKPQKEGFYTLYKDGKRLFGSWLSRLTEWENTLKHLEG